MSIPIGSRLGPYEILAPLGAGGMGEVYCARDPRLGREVAIKVLPSHRLSDETRRRRFVQEARSASSLNHPSIVTIHEIEREGEVDFIVMELVRGKGLERLIPPQGMRLDDALRIGIQVADGLARAHAAGIVHRDLKPANVVVSEEGVPKILDFGLAKLLETEAPGEDAAHTRSTLSRPLSEAGAITGTPGYMSPEQVTGDKVDARSDVFSFGAMLHEMVTGRRAFSGATRPEALAATVSSAPRPPSELREGVPAELDRLIMRCLRKEPERRFQHMADLKVALQEVAEEIASGSSLRTSATVAAKTAGRRWGWAVGAAALLLAAAIAAWRLERAGFFWRNPLANAQFTRITDFEGAELDGAISRDGKFVAFLSARDGAMDGWVSQIGTGSFHNLTKGRATELNNEGSRNLIFSPDGALVCLWVRTPAAPGKLQVGVWAVPTLGGELRPFLEDAVEPGWSPDGKQMVYHLGGPGDPLFVTDRSGGVARQIYVAPSGVHCHYPTWSPDGAFIYFVRGSPPDETDIWRIPPAGGNPERLTSHNARVSHPTLLDARTLLYIAPAEDGSGPSLYGMDVERRVPHRLSLGVEQYTSIAASSEGQRLVATVSTPESSLWRVPISNRLVDGSSASRIPVRALSPRLGPGYLLYVKDGGRGIWKLEQERATELWTPVEGRVAAPPAISPKGERVSFSVRRGQHTRLYSMNADGTGARPLAESLEVRGGGAWSPDAEKVAVAVDQGNGPQLFLVPRDNGAPRAVSTEYSIDPVWSPDGAFIVFSGRQLGPGFPVQAVTPEGKPVPLPPLTLSRGDRFRFLPGGGALVLLKKEGSRRDFWLFDLATGSQRRLTDFGAEYAIQDFDVSADGQEIVFDRVKGASDIVLIELPGR